MNKNARCYYESAKKLRLPVEDIPEIDGFKFSIGQQNYYFFANGTPFNDSSCIQIARNKYATNRLLEKAGFPVAKAIVIHAAEYNSEILEKKLAVLSFPVVAKPQNGKLGEKVLCNIQTFAQLKTYLDNNIARYPSISIEEFHGNLNAYRVLIFNKRILGVIQRYPAQVIGNGQHNLQELINLTNAQRLKTSDTLGPILIDEEVKIRLAELGIDLQYVPKKNELIRLCYTCNATRGGTYKSLATQICPENSKLLIRAAATLNFKLVGFDIQCVDINIPMAKSHGIIIEANDGPSIRIHEYPIEGEPVLVSKTMLKSILYRHPIAYLSILYKAKPSAIYLRGLTLLILLGLTYLIGY